MLPSPRRVPAFVIPIKRGRVHHLLPNTEVTRLRVSDHCILQMKSDEIITECQIC